MASSLLPLAPLGLHPFSSLPCVHGDRSCWSSSQTISLPALRATNIPSGQNPRRGSKRDVKVMYYTVGSTLPSALDFSTFSVDEIPTWAIWVLGSLVLLIAAPYYKQILEIEGEAEKTVVAALDKVEEVAEEVEKASADAAAIPGISPLQQITLQVELMAETVDMDAKLAEAFVQKVDEVLNEVDEIIEPIIQAQKNPSIQNDEKKINATNSE